MAQVDRRAAAAGEFIGKDIFLKTFVQQAGNISAAQLTTLVGTVQNQNLSVLKVGPVVTDTVSMIVEGADNLANGDIAGHVISNLAF